MPGASLPTPATCQAGGFSARSNSVASRRPSSQQEEHEGSRIATTLRGQTSDAFLICPRTMASHEHGYAGCGLRSRPVEARPLEPGVMSRRENPAGNVTPSEARRRVRRPMEASPAISPAARQKSLGAFYTPAPMAEKMVAWAVRASTDRVLDPSFGGLVFLDAARARLQQLGASASSASAMLYGCDLDEDAHAAARAHYELSIPDGALVHRDFFSVAPGQGLPLAHAVVGNPPYVRYQLANGSGDSGHRVAAAAGIQLTRLASTWAPFVLHSTAFVAPGGRLALVLPAELLHAQYAEEVLGFVQQRFARTALAVFEQRVFPGALEEVVLLFADGRGEGQCRAVDVIQCDTTDDLDVRDMQARMAARSCVPASTGHAARQSASPGRQKLLAQLLPATTQDLYGQLASGSYAQMTTLGALGSVDIGAVTGANDFFLLAADDEPRLATELLRPAVSKAMHVKGARFAQGDYDGMLANGTRCRLFVATSETHADLLATSSAYQRRGRERGIHKRYKCRVREPWWAVPLPKHGAPTLFLTYCSSEYPRLVLNEAQVLHTNTVHGVSLRPDANPRALAAGFYNSLTLLSAELVGRSYGGGVLKLEPTEAEALLIPPVPDSAAEHLEQVDALLRLGDLKAVLDLMDRLVLVEGLGLTEPDVMALRAGAERLRSRRRARGKAPKVAKPGGVNSGQLQLHVDGLDRL